MVKNNNVITAITLMERMKPLLHVNDRAPISARHLKQISERLSTVLTLIKDVTRDPLIMIPIGEVLTLIDTLQSESNFVETSSEVKEIICNKIFSALEELYLFGGRFYENHEFDYNIGQDIILQTMVDVNIQNGYYFGLEVS